MSRLITNKEEPLGWGASGQRHPTGWQSQNSYDPPPTAAETSVYCRQLVQYGAVYTIVYTAHTSPTVQEYSSLYVHRESLDSHQSQILNPLEKPFSDLYLSL